MCVCVVCVVEELVETNHSFFIYVTSPGGVSRFLLVVSNVDRIDILLGLLAVYVYPFLS